MSLTTQTPRHQDELSRRVESFLFKTIQLLHRKIIPQIITLALQEVFKYPENQIPSLVLANTNKYSRCRHCGNELWTPEEQGTRSQSNATATHHTGSNTWDLPSNTTNYGRSGSSSHYRNNSNFAATDPQHDILPGMMDWSGNLTESSQYPNDYASLASSTAIPSSQNTSAFYPDLTTVLPQTNFGLSNESYSLMDPLNIESLLVPPGSATTTQYPHVDTLFGMDKSQHSVINHTNTSLQETPPCTAPTTMDHQWNNMIECDLLNQFNTKSEAESPSRTVEKGHYQGTIFNPQTTLNLNTTRPSSSSKSKNNANAIPVQAIRSTGSSHHREQQSGSGLESSARNRYKKDIPAQNRQLVKPTSNLKPSDKLPHGQGQVIPKTAQDSMGVLTQDFTTATAVKRPGKQNKDNKHYKDNDSCRTGKDPRVI